MENPFQAPRQGIERTATEHPPKANQVPRWKQFLYCSTIGGLAGGGGVAGIGGILMGTFGLFLKANELLRGNRQTKPILGIELTGGEYLLLLAVPFLCLAGITLPIAFRLRSRYLKLVPHGNEGFERTRHPIS